jgi:predicted secreted acid phosphatase
VNPSSYWLRIFRAPTLAALGLACAGTATQGGSPAVSPATVSSDIPLLYEAQQQVEEYISSGRYDRDFSAVVARAQEWLELRSKTAKKPAIVLDIDETSLSNWPAYRLNGWGRVVGGGCDLEQGPCGLRAWQALARSQALAPTRELSRRAHELGVAVFFISGRPPNLREATERNLREQGYDPTGVILLPEGAHFKSAVDFKAPERRKIAEQGYTIILSLGDQESDLAGGFAERTFHLPNPVYYLP